jgi:hypothetical protein
MENYNVITENYNIYIATICEKIEKELIFNFDPVDMDSVADEVGLEIEIEKNLLLFIDIRITAFFRKSKDDYEQYEKIGQSAVVYNLAVLFFGEEVIFTINNEKLIPQNIEQYFCE